MGQKEITDKLVFVKTPCWKMFITPRSNLRELTLEEIKVHQLSQRITSMILYLTRGSGLYQPAEKP